MACPLEEMTRLLSGLSVGMPSKQTLESIRVILTSITPSELKEYAPKIDIARIFTCLSTTDSEQITLASEILTHLLKYLSHEYVLNRFEDLLLEGLSHMDKDVKEFILEQLFSAASKSTAELLSTKLELLLLCVRLVGSEEVGSKATNVLTALAKQGVILAPQLVEEMRVVMQKSETVRFRVYDIIVTVASSSPENLAACEETEILQSLIIEVSSDDILILLNGVELLKTLIVSSHGRSYLEKHGTIKTLADKFIQLADDPMGGLIIPGMMKFFGVLCHYDPGAIERHARVIDAIFDFIYHGDPSLRTVAIETFAFIASNGEAKLTLSSPNCEKALKTIGTWISQGDSEYRIKILNSISEFMAASDDSKVLEANERWFNLISDSPVEKVISVAKQPFKELRYAALDVFLSLSEQLWAQRLMSKQPGFLEFLLDRRAEPDKDCIERKFHIVQSIAKVPEDELMNIWGRYAVSQIHQHLREGPWFSRAQANVAFESQG